VRLSDGTYRVLGIHSTTGSDCDAGGQRGHESAPAFVALSWIEKETGVDLTPCRDASGAWDGLACNGVPADPSAGSGAWGSCTWSATVPLTDLCPTPVPDAGAPDAAEPDAGEPPPDAGTPPEDDAGAGVDAAAEAGPPPGDGGEPTHDGGAASDAGADAGTGAGSSGGCACDMGGAPPASGAGVGLLGALALLRTLRRRSRALTPPRPAAPRR
jgi:MYXO-CTERM domain-containing protein